VLLGTLSYAVMSKGVFTKKLGYSLVGTYAVFALLVTAIAFTDAYVL
jgi:hypothetical protein